MYIFTLVYIELLETSIQNQAMGSTETTRPLVQNREGKADFFGGCSGEINLPSFLWLIPHTEKKEWGNSEKQHDRNMGKKYG